MQVNTRSVSPSDPRPPKRPIAAIYARAGSGDAHSLHQQVDACRRWAAAHGVIVASSLVFCDVGPAMGDREGLRGLTDALDRDQVELVLVAEPDRLWRQAVKMKLFVEKHMIGRGKRLLAVLRGVDTPRED